MAKLDLWGGPPFYIHTQYRLDKSHSAKSSRVTKNQQQNATYSADWTGDLWGLAWCSSF